MKAKQKLISVSAFGPYTPGLVALITNKIFEMEGNIVDVEENCRRGLFSIFLVVDFSTSKHTTERIISILSEIQEETGIKIILARYDDKAAFLPSQHESHLVTIIGVDQPGIIAKVSSLFHRYSVTIEKCRMIARGAFFSMEVVIDTSTMLDNPEISHDAGIKKMKTELRKLCTEIDQSVVIQSGDIYQRSKKLVVFDVESSLVQQASLKKFIKTINGRMQISNDVCGPRETVDGQEEALVDNAKRLKGLSADDLEKYIDILQLNPGTFELIKILKSMGFKIALLSSGFNFFIKIIFETAGVDYAFSNTLEIDETGIFTGNLEQPIITNDTKEELLEFIMQNENIRSEQIIAVGDGSKASHFIKNVGLSIALKPENPSVMTDGVLSNDQLLNVLYCLGIPKEELSKYLSG
ncbi:MAG: HAD-IB family phosphatase [Desulfobacterales bacterium]|nr:HAD-IB family phosphatase [Desulfobacterales bacterium]MDX2510773.1 HAD-IB family phosphatase [Desulfobacterales bacterium]